MTTININTITTDYINNDHIICKHSKWNSEIGECINCGKKYDWITSDCINFTNSDGTIETTDQKNYLVYY